MFLSFACSRRSMRVRGAVAFGAFALVGVAQAATDAALAQCRALDDAAARLACYDRLAEDLAGRGAAPAAPAVSASEALKAAKAAGDSALGPTLDVGDLDDTWLGRWWELRPADKRGTFRVTDYKSSFFLPVHFSDRMNTRPTTPAPGHTGQLGDYRRLETKLQLSMRAKLIEGAGLPNADLWFAYTQTSLWQLWNRSDSAPFRSTDHEPELIYVLPVSWRPPVLRDYGWRLRMVDARVTHQSNGQSLPLSRSWNRVSVGLAFENAPADMTVSARLWQRLGESDDDNPDLIGWRGRGEFMLTWTPGLSVAALQWRTGFDRVDRGALQLDWTYPVHTDNPQGLRWYLQLFTGYGETLQDYNFKSTSLGLGLALFRF